MRQPPQPQSSSTPTPSGTDGHGPATPYGVMPHGPYAPASPPHAALTPSHGPQSGQQVDYPYLFQAQTAPPTQPVAPHLSSIGQPASSIVTNGADIDPYSAGPTASFPRFAPAPTPGTLPVTPQPSAPPAPVGAPPLGVTRTNPLPSPAPWRRDRVIALVTALIACGTQVAWILYDLHRQPRFTAPPGFTLNFILYLFFYTLSTPGVWWIVLHFSSLKTIFENRPTSVMVAATFQILLIDIFIFNDNIISTPMPILCLLTTGSAAIAATIMNQHTPTARPWFVTLGSAVNLFMLVIALHQLANSARYILSGTNASERTINLWMSVSTASNYRGAPLTSGIFLMIVTSLIATISLYLGSQNRHIVAFSRIVGIAPIIMVLTNMYILLAHGISATSIGSALGMSSMGQSFPYVVFRAWTASILLGAIAVGIIVLLHRRTSTMKHTTHQFVPAATSAQQPQYVNYRPYTP